MDEANSSVQIHWLPPTIYPNLLASIGTDGKFKLWAEDPTVPPLSGRRFNPKSNKPVWEMRSSTRAPFHSFDIKHHPDSRETFLAIVDKGALLTVYVNEEPENIANWTQVDQFLVCEKPPIGEEVAFKVQFDPSLEPCYTSVRQGVPRDALGIIVAGMETARIWRTKLIAHEVSLGSGASREFYRAADLPGHEGLVRDVAWAPGSIRGYDICATACKDGFLRIFEVKTPPKDGEHPSAIIPKQMWPAHTSAKMGPSGIGAGLATVRARPGEPRSNGKPQRGQVQHVVREVAKLNGHNSQVWRCQFDADGMMLLSSGDDGRLILWRRKADGGWLMNGEIALERGVDEGDPDKTL